MGWLGATDQSADAGGAAVSTAHVRLSSTCWWHDAANVEALFAWLCRTDRIDPENDKAVRYYRDKPWKWSIEFREMVLEGKED